MASVWNVQVTGQIGLAQKTASKAGWRWNETRMPAESTLEVTKKDAASPGPGSRGCCSETPRPGALRRMVQTHRAFTQDLSSLWLGWAWVGDLVHIHRVSFSFNENGWWGTNEQLKNSVSTSRRSPDFTAAFWPTQQIPHSEERRDP